MRSPGIPTAGTLTNLQSVETNPHDFAGENHSAEIAVSPDGKFLYESNRRNTGDTGWGPDTIGIFAIDPEKGTLTLVEQTLSGAIMPRNFAIDPTGSFMLVAHQYSNNVIVFKIDQRHWPPDRRPETRSSCTCRSVSSLFRVQLLGALSYNFACSAWGTGLTFGC